VEQLGWDFTDYELEDANYRQAVTHAQQVLTQLGRIKVVQR